MALRLDVRTAFFGLLLAVATVLVFLVVVPFVTYLLAALLLAFLLYPLHRRLSSRVDDRLSALALVSGAVGALGAFVAVLVVTLPADASALSRGVRQGTDGTLQRRLEESLGVDLPVEAALADAPGRVAELLVGDLSGIVSAAVDAFLGAILLVFLVYYLLVDGAELVAWVTDVMPLEEEMAADLRDEVHATTWAVLKGHVFIAVVQGIVAGFGLFVVGIPNVVFWTVVMAFLELFPVVGVAGVLGPAVLFLVLVDRLLAAGFLALYGLTAVAVVDDYLRAFVVDRESSLHSATILVGVFGGVYAFGVMGLFYGPIVLGVFQTLVRLFDENYAADAGNGE